VPFLVLSKLERFVPANIRKRGAEYARAGAVAMGKRQSANDPLWAEVYGGHVYQVSLRYSDRALWATCSCPFFDRDFDICKHIWALLIQCEQSGTLFSGPVDDLLSDDEAPFDDDGELLLEDDDDDDFRAPPPQRAPYLRAVPSRWRSQISGITPASGESADGVRVPPEIIWVLDPETSATTVSIEITSRSIKKNGELGKPQILKLDPGAVARVADARDREILSILTRSQYGYGSLEPRQSIGWPLGEYLIPRIVETGRLWIRAGKGTYETCASFDAGEPWRLAVRAEEQEGNYLLVASFHRGEETLPIREPLAVTRGGFLIFHNSIARFADDGTHAWASLLRRDRVEIPAAEIDDFIKASATSRAPVRIEFPDAVAWRERDGVLRAVIEIRSPNWNNNDAVPTFEYDGLTVDALTRSRALYDEKTKSIVVRDAAGESHKLDTLWEQGFTRSRETLSIASSRLGNAIPKLLEAGWEVHGAEGTYAGFGELDLSLRSGIDWFDLEATATFGSERIRLPRLLAALRKGESFVTLSDGRLGMIRPEWREQLEPFLATASDEHKDGLRFRRNQVLLLDALLATRKNVAFDEVFEQARRKILDVKVQPEQPPASFTGELRPYQSEGLGWFTFLRSLGFGGCLADDMGLGKTIQVLALLDQRRGELKNDRRPSLVVVPRSVVFNWKKESARFTPDLRVLDHATPDRIRATDHFMEYDLVLTTYALLRNEVELFADFEFDYVILDEAQAIKNASSQAAKAATLLRARHRLALSGTPVENHLGELASLFEFLNPGMLRAKTTRVTKMLRDAGSKTPQAAEARTMLARTVRPFILRRTKAQVATELPDRVEQTIYCDLEPKQRKLYDELRDFYRASLLGRVAEKGLNRSKIHILEALLRTRQAACHPGLVDAKRVNEPSAKLDKLFEELPILIDERHKVLVFSQFTSLLAIVQREMKARDIKYAYLDGKTRDREAEVKRFQEDPDIPVFLISLKAGGLGLNLTAADYVFLLDPWWNPAVEAQAIDRAHRIGQSRNVVAFRLVARDTIEEKILLLQQSKRDLAEAIIGAENSILRQLTAEDLDLLLS
jgi:Superfamily II DNA/RNA helicases, SNF2 family